MEENRIITLGKRERGTKRFWLSILCVVIIAGLFAGDLYFYITAKEMWNIVGLWILAAILLISVMGTGYVLSAYLYTNKIADTPLVAYDTQKEEFIVYSFLTHKEIRIKKEDAQMVKVADTGEAFMWRKQNGKTRITHIGYAFSGTEQLINKKIKDVKENKIEEEK